MCSFLFNFSFTLLYVSYSVSVNIGSVSNKGYKSFVTNSISSHSLSNMEYMKLLPSIVRSQLTLLHYKSNILIDWRGSRFTQTSQQEKRLPEFGFFSPHMIHHLNDGGYLKEFLKLQSTMNNRSWSFLWKIHIGVLISIPDGHIYFPSMTILLKLTLRCLPAYISKWWMGLILKSFSRSSNDVYSIGKLDQSPSISFLICCLVAIALIIFVVF